MKTVTWLKKTPTVFTKIDDNPQVTTLITDSYPHNIPQCLILILIFMYIKKYFSF